MGPFVSQFLGSVHDAAGGFWMDVPQGVGFDAPSLADYTVNPLPVPEPSRPLLALAGAGILAAVARTRAARTPPAGSTQATSYFASDGAAAKWGASAAIPAIEGDFMCALSSSGVVQRSTIT